ncbi:MAG: phosphate/phosphite/phosphonate ABC transporter substrate-binding protein [Candidatus Hydrogenedentes bacterium]|nr:phosphate/phosphite/phosphonate ABC transporter substrate-binding protein [Candidatus Hydrogenedentota bacterium]
MKTKAAVVLLFVVLGLAGMTTAAHAAHSNYATANKPIQFGLTAVVVRENLRLLDVWAQYLSDRMGQPVEFVQRRSYREVMDMLGSGGLDFAWICGFPFVQKRDPEFVELLLVPVYQGKPLYRSYIIVHRDSPYQSMDDLAGKIFAFSDPESNSGYLYPQFFLANQGDRPETYFHKTFFTFNHAETVEAVAEQVADGGAVDSYIWEYLREFQPEVADKTRVIQKSPTFGFPPLVSRLGADPDMVERMKAVLMGMSSSPDGRVLLDALKLDGFGEFSPSLFDSIRDMAAETRKARPWIEAAEEKEKELRAEEIE